jgi:hypothetical protein
MDLTALIESLNVHSDTTSDRLTANSARLVANNLTNVRRREPASDPESNNLREYIGETHIDY